MKAITTKYIPATNTRGARISASDCDGNRVIVPYITKGPEYESYLYAAHWLCAKMSWDGELIGGAIKGGYVFVFMPTLTE